jgi:hypothetical protein
MSASPLSRFWHSELADSLRRGVLIGLAVVAVALPAMHVYRSHRQAPPAVSSPAGIARSPAASQGPRFADFAGEQASDDARHLADWIVDSGDNKRMNFVILDKRNAKVFVFNAAGQLNGASPVLLGAAPGDDSVAGIGKRPIAQVRPEERTTPAGRFVAEPGRNAIGEDVVWVDYDAAVSMHRVRVTDPKERRLERLASPTTADNRISYGCINIPVAFFEGTVKPAFEKRYGVVYVLPETKTLQEVFSTSYDVARRHGGTPPPA